ncbi:TPA: indolepyruvate ferredoxin oxidoreductase family protein [Pseudomonas aeruginosa]|uniref:indolepyruvate ferredoxin oxidoreductase family protein n=1 Tax=Pseudomonas aeruginosa group TaxID=136841 RepID=UPI0005BB5C9F|nr:MULTISPECIES: indolepyruvate ferredoxin oxidoreductase family protein [Pseudomonas aeruginosa group]MDF3934073.1 indolepyruvate ferredoxin oxidoreductase family protein [Pseudomonas citronellolis]MDI9795389.1 indolepyruvate ferredoxin oxidoreductase family protein [Pseudomonas aeruginosa]NPX94174.1 indolepyruvate ferredoxin oxidoreductase family protein [Pseudomonas aeruginosa]HBO4122971.1 indolepyruvate ferredoxin oxidoreductase family protein [Pseudomonas aeruginosa]HBO4250076.1 indolepyr
MSTPLSLEDKYAQKTGKALMTGIQALVRLPLMQRQRDLDNGLDTAGFISGYRGSPLGGFDQALWKARDHLKQHQVLFQPGVNEDLAATSLWGTQQVNLFPGAKHDGVFGIWYGKGPGVDRCGDVFRHANAAGTSRFGGVLAIAGDDHGARSSSLPHQTEHIFKAVMMPVLAPSGVQEYLDYGLHGFAMSRYSGCWVALKAVADTVESAAIVDLDINRVKPVIPDFALPEGGLNIRWPDPPLAQEQRLLEHKLYAAAAYARANGLNRVTLDSSRARIGIITSGKSYLDVCQALDILGIDQEQAERIGLRVYKVGMVWPLEAEGVRQFAEGLEEIVVVEEKRHMIEYQLKEELYNWREDVRPRIVGKFDDKGEWSLPHTDWLLPAINDLTPAQIARALAKRILRLHPHGSLQMHLAVLDAQLGCKQQLSNLMERVPHYCSGCPHNSSTKVPEGSRALAGIGCHYMAAWIYPRTETFSQMGGEGVAWVGQAPFTETRHVFANLGDGTYFHSGLLAIRAAVAAKVSITYKILYNDAVAMTGGQPVDGSLSVAQISRQLAAEGVQRIVVVSDDPDRYQEVHDLAAGVPVLRRDLMEEVQKQLREFPGVSAIIYDQTCAAEKRRRRKRGKFPDPARRVVINEAVCEGCGDCSNKSNCMSVVAVETEFGSKRAIDQSSCNKDFTCLSGFCPSFVTVEGGRLRKPKALVQSAGDVWELPQPLLPDLGQPYSILVTGVGGTGVVTIGALLGMAAFIEGKGVLNLDMAGMAQKGGAVWSHIRIAARQEQLFAPRIAEGEASLLLGCDLVVSANTETLAKLRQGVSHALINSEENITSAFVRTFSRQAESGDLLENPDPRFRSPEMAAQINEAVGAERAEFVDASAIATALMGDSIATNTFMLGYAYQKGWLPVGETALLEAIELNGTAVEFNRTAFVWGRRSAADSQRVHQLLAAGRVQSSDRQLSQTLDEIVARRTEILTDYQDAAYAERYRKRVERFSVAESTLNGQPGALTEAVARNYFKALAIKDEYEVARLFANDEFIRKIEATFEGDYHLNFHLAPPLLNKTAPGVEAAKRSFGPWMLKGLRLLSRFRRLRNTWLDPFARTHERKVERAWLESYEAILDEVLARFTADNLATALELARLPDAVRGYGPVKERYLAHAETRKTQLLARLRGEAQFHDATQPTGMSALIQVTQL